MATASRRSAILEAARTEFADYGYSGARIERIAASANVNKQLIFHYFGSKDGIYAAAVASIFGTAPVPLDGAASPSESLRLYVAELASWFSRTPGAALAASECAPGRPVPSDAASTVSGWTRLASAGISSTIDDGQRKGYFRDDIDSQSVVEFVVGSAVGSALLGHQFHKAPSPATSFAPLLAQLAVDLCVWR